MTDETENTNSKEKLKLIISEKINEKTEMMLLKLISGNSIFKFNVMILIIFLSKYQKRKQKPILHPHLLMTPPGN